jgi:ubiquilin
VEELKEKISSLEEELPATSQRLIYSGRVLKDTETLEFYKIKDGHTIHLVKSANKAAPTSVSGASSSEVATQPTSASNAVPINLAAGSGAFNPLADLTGARYAGYTQLPSASMFGPDGGMSLPNPEDMERMLENPMVQQSMNEMLSNPQMVDFLINQSPEMRAMGPQARELLQSEGFRNMLTNPQMLRQMRDMQRIMGGGQQQQQQAFPAPGSSETTESIDDTATNTSATQQPANPFAAMFPGGIPQNPFTLFGNQQGGTNGSTGANPWGAPDPEMMQAIMASLGGGSSSASQQDTRPPEERYADQLRQLNEMGFNDFERNVLALRRSGGNVQGAVENLLRDGF